MGNLLWIIISLGALAARWMSRLESSMKDSAGSESGEDNLAIENAWKIHSALADWTGKVDAKASFCFAVESAALVAVVNLTADGRLFGELNSVLTKLTFAVGISLLVASVLCSARVVSPRLRRAATRDEWTKNYIYFGHLRNWDPVALEKELRNGSILPVLSVQLTNMSKVAWRKHRMVQISLTLGLTGVAALGICTFAVS